MIKKIAGTPLYVIVLVNLVLKLALFCYISPWDKNMQNTRVFTGDSQGYEQVAERLVNNHTYAIAKDTIDINKMAEFKATGYIMMYPDGWMMPAYPTFLAGIYSVFGVKPWLALFIQILLSLISVVLVYRICLFLFQNSKIATIAALLYSLDIHSIFSASELLTDTLFVLLLLTGIYYFLKGMKSGKLAVICLAAFFMGLACLTRLLVLLYPIVLVIMLLFFAKQKLGWKLKAIVSYGIVFGLLTSVWAYRNHNAYNHWQLTAHGGWTLLMFNTSLTEARLVHENIDTLRMEFQKQADSMGFRKSKDIFVQSEMYQKLATNYIAKHKAMYVLTNLQGCFNMFFSIGNLGMAKTFGWTDATPDRNFADVTTKKVIQNFTADWRQTILGIVILLILIVEYIGAAIGIIKLIRARNFMLLALLFLSIGYFCAVTGILGNYRFKLPVVPLICMAAGYGYVNQKEKELSTKN